MEWLYNNKKITNIPDDAIAFVYRITNMVTGKSYIGKKQLYSYRKVKRKRTKRESDWRVYFGSNKELLADILLYGTESFRRDILHFCSKKGEASYYEAKYQFEFDVLRHPDLWYNTWIMCRIHQKHLD